MGYKYPFLPVIIQISHRFPFFASFHVNCMVGSSSSRNGLRRPGRPPRLRGAVVGRRGASVRPAASLGVPGGPAAMMNSPMPDARLLRRGVRSVWSSASTFMADSLARCRGACARPGLFCFRFLFYCCLFILRLFCTLSVLFVWLSRVFSFGV